ncbi:MAG: hypothetical protein WC824_05900 [Bacteroidota bacterium]
MPPEESDAALFELTMETLAGWGFHQYEVSNYAKEGYESRHNLTYWRHEDYLGFGPSAHSTMNSRRWWNLRSVQSYLESMREGHLPEAGGEFLTPETLRSEFIFLRLRSEGIPLPEFIRRFGSDLHADNRAFIDHCITDGMLRLDDERLSLTNKGLLVCDEICAELK